MRRPEAEHKVSILGLKSGLIPENPLKMESCHFDPFWSPSLRETGPNSKKQVPYHFGVSFLKLATITPERGQDDRFGSG